MQIVRDGLDSTGAFTLARRIAMLSSVPKAPTAPDLAMDTVFG